MCMICDGMAPDRCHVCQREKLASWMLAMGFATGHGDTIDTLLSELAWQVGELRRRARYTIRERQSSTLGPSSEPQGGEIL